jgi:DNA adenine methylase
MNPACFRIEGISDSGNGEIGMTNAIGKEIKTHSPIRWFGGKKFMAKHIISLFPNHHCFCDVFGGGGSVTVAKPRGISKVEIFNDLDNDLLHFLWTLRNHKHELMAALNSMPTSRSLYRYVVNSPTPADPIERAAYWFYKLRQMGHQADSDTVK